MTWTSGKRRIRAWQRPVLGMLLVVSFLGHDLLMAAEAVAAPSPPAGTAHHGRGQPAAHVDMPARQHHEPPREHPENCRIGQSAVAQSANPFARGNQDLLISDGIVDIVIGAHDDGAFLWEEPHWPPSTLRALFQVYRN